MILLPSFGCVVHKPRDMSSISEHGPIVIAHRGGSALAPENTMAAFRSAVSLGAGIELDTMLSADLVPVVIHDYTLERTTNGSGPVADQTLAQLQQLDAGSFFARSFSTETIPTLAQVLDFVRGQVWVNVEIKCEETGEMAKKTGVEVARVIIDSGHADKVVVSSFNPMLLSAVREAAPQLLRGQLYGSFEDTTLPWYKKLVLRNLLLNFRSIPDFLGPEILILTAENVKAMQSEGYLISSWTLNNPEEWQKALDWGVSLIITDHPDRALGWLAEHKS